MIKYSKKSQLNNLMLKYYIFVSVLVFLGVIGVGYLFYIRDYSAEVFTYQEQNLELSKKKVEEQKIYLENMKEIEAYYSQIDDDVKKSISRAVPQTQNIAEIYTEIEAIVLQNGLKIRSLDFSIPPNQEKQDLRNIHIALNVASGSYESFRALLEKIEKNLRLYDISSIKYSPTALVYSIDFTAYYLEDK